MRRATVVATAAAATMMGLGTWSMVHLRRALPSSTAPTVAAEQAAETTATAIPATPAAAPDEGGPQAPAVAELDVSRFKLPTQPPTPAVGSRARQPYLQALAAGDERGLAAIRQALAAAGSGATPGEAPPHDAYRRGLEEMEQAYVQRLERHHRDLMASRSRPTASR